MYTTNKELINIANLSPIQSEFYSLYNGSINLVQTFCDKHFEYSNDIELQKEEFKWNFYINPEEVFVNLFKNIITTENNNSGN